MDGGTLFQLRNLIHRGNVHKDLSDDFDASQNFFELVTYGYILSAAMTVFQMEALDAQPSNLSFDSSDKSEVASQISVQCEQLVDRYTDLSFSNPKEIGSNPDRVYGYSCDIITQGLLFMEFTDAIREGDGHRVLRCYKFLMLLFKVTGRKNYAIDSFILLAQYYIIFTPRMAEELKWSRFVNTHGRPGKNVSADLHMEYLNKEVKTAIAGLGSNITDNSIQRIGKCIGELVKVTANYDGENRIPSESGRHFALGITGDLEKVVKELVTSKVLQQIPGRAHVAFKKHVPNPLRKLKPPDILDWMRTRFKKLPNQL